MSADRPDPAEFVDDRDTGEIDPYDIVPDTFCRDWRATSIPEALRTAERAPSTTGATEQQRCPECASIRIRRKSDAVEMAHKRPEAYTCLACGAHFDEPDAAVEASRAGEQATLREVTRE